MKYCFVFCLILLPLIAEAVAIEPVKITSGESTFIQKEEIALLEDKTNDLSFQEVQKTHFTPNTKEVVNFGLSNSTFWLRFSITNNTPSNSLFLNITNPILDSVTAYFFAEGRWLAIRSGEGVPFSQKAFKSSHPIFEIPVKPGSSILIYLKVKSKGPVSVPIYMGPPREVLTSVARDDTLFGIYLGIIGVMLIYNLFIFFSVRDRDYLWYVIFIAAIGITQVCLNGYGYRYLWHRSEFITNQSLFWSGALSAIATLLFSKSFLRTKLKLPVVDKLFNVFIILDVIGVILSSLHLYHYSYQIINTVAFIGAISIFIAALILTIRGFKPAKFFLLALSFFLLSVIVFIFLTSNLIPYTLLTRNILLIGSAVEIMLLSFALADKINVYRQEKEQSQLEVLKAVREKEDFVRKQNIILESKVQQRTLDLQQANRSLRQANISLNIAMENQKKTESKLVHAEKMASLGQLTAGIAHEINNPINFVKSNIKPLARDIDDLNTLIAKYKEITKENLEEKLQEIEAFIQEIDLDILNEEIPSLLSGIEDGATRTAEIVTGLRIFSRVDENALKKADIHAGIDSTLVLLNNIIPYNLTIEKDYDQIPLIDCYPGKLNQVFMNLLTNAVQALNAKPDPEHEHIGIKTINKGDLVEIHISDTGMGIPEDIQNKIFDPFFTTKDVGEGTGLGLSMSYSIIEEHGGEIKVDSQVGKGTKFIITLPVSQDDVIAGKGD